jgi:hypothetical protein
MCLEKTYVVTPKLLILKFRITGGFNFSTIDKLVFEIYFYLEIFNHLGFTLNSSIEFFWITGILEYWNTP